MILTSGKIRGMIVSSLLAISACQNKADVNPASTKKGSLDAVIPEPLEEELPNEKEQVVPPANITGSYLNCQVVNVPFDAENASALGCAIYDEKTDGRIDIATIASNIDWSYDRSKVPAGTNITIFKALKEQNLDFDVYYSFSDLAEDFNGILTKFTIIMDVTSLDSAHTVYRNSVFLKKPGSSGAPTGNPASEKPEDILGGP